MQELRERYEHNAKDFAQQILQPNSGAGTGTGGLYGNRKHGGHAEEDQEEPIFNINLVGSSLTGANADVFCTILT